MRAGRLGLVLGLLLFALPAGAQHAVYRRSPTGELLPDKDATPGVVALTDKAKVCGIAWGKDERHVTQAEKGRVCMLYGAKACPGPRWELDHLVSRELGGSDDWTNLWPQPIGEARHKDRLETALHKAVCAGAITLGHAQEVIRSDWSKEYHRRFDP
jgi:hypothetical protein